MQPDSSSPSRSLNSHESAALSPESLVRSCLIPALAVSSSVALYLKFLLLTTAGLFYELHHLTAVEFIYWFYSAFKVAAVYFAQWPAQNLFLALLWLVLTGLLYWRRRRKIRGNAGVAETAKTMMEEQP
jgi:hypothetical protein